MMDGTGVGVGAAGCVSPVPPFPPVVSDVPFPEPPEPVPAVLPDVPP